MLTGGTDPLYRNILSTAHEHYVRIEVWSGLGGPLETPIPVDQVGTQGGLAFTTGRMFATLDSRVSRTLSFAVDEQLYPDDTADLLAPFGNEIRAFRGVVLGDGSTTYTWQVFRGRIQDVEQESDSAVCTVYCSDRATDVLDVAFETPQNSLTINTVPLEVRRLITDAVPNAAFGVFDDFSTPTKPLTWQFDRGSALDELAKSVGAIWYPLANGDFVLRKLPWTVPANPVATVTDQTGGTVNGWQVRRTRSSIFNVVTVTGERLNGDEPVFATVSDDNAASPTFVDGGFGVRSLLDRLQTPSSSGGVQAAARSLLQDSIAPVETWVLSMVPDAALELGDVLRVQVNNRDVIQVVYALEMPLDLSGNMTVYTRSLVTGQLEVAG